MASKADRSFACLLWLSERLSEQSHELQERSESDYVFFSPASRENDARPPNLERRIGAHPEGQSGLSEDNGGVLSGNRLDRRL